MNRFSDMLMVFLLFKIHFCIVDCELSPELPTWIWSKATHDCGQGTRASLIVQEAMYGGKNCADTPGYTNETKKVACPSK